MPGLPNITSGDHVPALAGSLLISITTVGGVSVHESVDDDGLADTEGAEVDCGTRAVRGGGDDGRE